MGHELKTALTLVCATPSLPSPSAFPCQDLALPQKNERARKRRMHFLVLKRDQTEARGEAGGVLQRLTLHVTLMALKS